MCVYVVLPVRSFSLNWINGKTMLSAIWLASSVWSEFSWTTQNRLYKKNQALHKNTNRKWTIAKHLEGFQLVLLFTVTFAARHSSTERNRCRQCLCYIIKCLHCVTVHFMKKIVQPAAHPRYWKQGHTLHKQANPAIILYAYQQATL